VSGNFFSIWLFQRLAIFSASGHFSVWRFLQGERTKHWKRDDKNPPRLTEARRNFWKLMQFFQRLAFSASGNIFSISPF
jgi:hypothetical protein